MNLQEYIAQQTAPSMEAVDLIELLSLESSVREDLASMGQALNVTKAIDALNIDQLSNEAYGVAIESILTTAGMDSIPVEAIVPSFESSQALVVSSGAQHEEKGAKKKGILKRIWDFIKGLWQKVKAKFMSIFKSKKTHTAQLMIQQQKLESAASAGGYKLAALGHGHGLDGSANPVKHPDHQQAPGGHRQAAGLGYDKPKSISVGFLGHDAHGIAQGAHTVADHVGKLTHAVENAFHKLLAIDYNNMPKGKNLTQAVGEYNDKFKVGTTDISMFISRLGTQVNTIHGKHEAFEAKPDDIPVKELLQARHALVAAWDEQTKKLDVLGNQLNVLEKFINEQEAKVASTDDAAALQKSEDAANGIQRGLHFASGLIAVPVENAVRPALSEIDKLLGVK